MKDIVLAIDAMGGDHGPSVTIPAAFNLLARHSNVRLILVGDQEILNAKIVAFDAKLRERITIKHASEQVLMDELPSKALRSKKDSSMRVAIDLVKNKTAEACVSAGNTGALMAIARFVLKTLPGIDRPAITALFPTIIPNKSTYILDIGANVDSDSDYLYQIAIMGSVLASLIYNIDRPKVALLNIGSENNKGNQQIKEIAQILSESKHINYVGFVEGDDIFKGEVDVIVCDGFIGNVMLKSIEGVLKLVAFYVKKNMMYNIFTKILALLALPIFKKMYKDINPGKYNGATFIGLRGVVIKSHGGADIAAFTYALEKAVVEARRQIPQKISDELTKILQSDTLS